jgi:hypothetical protein
MSSQIFSQQVRHRFGRQADHYNGLAKLQRAIAWRLARHCLSLPLPPGPWADLGAGSGLVGQALKDQTHQTIHGANAQAQARVCVLCVRLAVAQLLQHVRRDLAHARVAEQQRGRRAHAQLRRQPARQLRRAQRVQAQLHQRRVLRHLARLQHRQHHC